MNPYAILAALALAGVAGWQGYGMGKARCEAVHVSELASARLAAINAASAAAEAEQNRLAVEEANQMLNRALEDKANADPVVVASCLGPDRMRRLGLN